jgi:hypothetical protein
MEDSYVKGVPSMMRLRWRGGKGVWRLWLAFVEQALNVAGTKRRVAQADAHHAEFLSELVHRRLQAFVLDLKIGGLRRLMADVAVGMGSFEEIRIVSESTCGVEQEEVAVLNHFGLTSVEAIS